jgi:hypothetical protein
LENSVENGRYLPTRSGAATAPVTPWDLVRIHLRQIDPELALGAADG